jgi:hypothetical protein
LIHNVVHVLATLDGADRVDIRDLLEGPIRDPNTHFPAVIDSLEDAGSFQTLERADVLYKRIIERKK